MGRKIFWENLGKRKWPPGGGHAVSAGEIIALRLLEQSVPALGACVPVARLRAGPPDGLDCAWL
jgi:hypothetical protein